MSLFSSYGLDNELHIKPVRLLLDTGCMEISVYSKIELSHSPFIYFFYVNRILVRLEKTSTRHGNAICNPCQYRDFLPSRTK